MDLLCKKLYVIYIINKISTFITTKKAFYAIKPLNLKIKKNKFIYLKKSIGSNIFIVFKNVFFYKKLYF